MRTADRDVFTSAKMASRIVIKATNNPREARWSQRTLER